MPRKLCDKKQTHGEGEHKKDEEEKEEEGKNLTTHNNINKPNKLYGRCDWSVDLFFFALT